MILSKIVKSLRSRDWGAALIELGIVVLGILIAVQIEQYRRFHSDRDTEKELLSEIASDLRSTRAELLDDREVLRERVIEINRLLVGLTKTNGGPVLGNAATLSAVLSQETLSPKKSGYESLLNIGLNKISESSIRQDLTNFYEVLLPNSIALNMRIDARTGDMLLEIFVAGVQLGPRPSEVMSRDEDSDFPVRVMRIVGIGDVRELAENPIVVPLLHYRGVNLGGLATQYQEAVEAIDQLLDGIETHLASL